MNFLEIIAFVIVFGSLGLFSAFYIRNIFKSIDQEEYGWTFFMVFTPIFIIAFNWAVDYLAK